MPTSLGAPGQAPAARHRLGAASASPDRGLPGGAAGAPAADGGLGEAPGAAGKLPKGVDCEAVLDRGLNS